MFSKSIQDALIHFICKITFAKFRIMKTINHTFLTCSEITLVYLELPYLKKEYLYIHYLRK